MDGESNDNLLRVKKKMVCFFDMFCANEITIYKVNANDIIRPFVEGGSVCTKKR